MTAYMYSEPWMLQIQVPSGLPSGNLPEPCGMRLFSYLLTGLLTDLLTEAYFTAYGPADGDCLRRWLGTTSNSLNLTPGSPRRELNRFIKRSVQKTICF